MEGTVGEKLCARLMGTVLSSTDDVPWQGRNTKSDNCSLLHDALEQYHAIEWEVAQCVEGVEEAACQWLANMDEDIEEVTVEAEYSHSTMHQPYNMQNMTIQQE